MLAQVCVTDENVAKATPLFVMLSEALQRNGNREARLSNISDYCLGERGQRSNLRLKPWPRREKFRVYGCSFASLRMTS